MATIPRAIVAILILRIATIHVVRTITQLLVLDTCLHQTRQTSTTRIIYKVQSTSGHLSLVLISYIIITHYNCSCILSHIIQLSTETYRLSLPIQLPPCPPTTISNVSQTRGSSHVAIWFNDHLKRQAMATKASTEQMDDYPANTGFYTHDDVTGNGQTSHACQSPITESRRAIQELVTKAQSKNSVTD